MSPVADTPAVEALNDNAQRTRARGKPWLAILGRALGVLSAFLVTAALARLLPDGSFGDFNMLLTILTPVSWWAVLGLNSSAVRLIGEEESFTGLAGARFITLRMLKVAGFSALVAIPVTWVTLWLGTHYLGFPLPRDPLLLGLFAVTVALFGIQLVVADCFYGHHEVGLAPLFTGGLMAGPVTTLLFLALLLGSALFSSRTGDAQLHREQLLGVTLEFTKTNVFQALLMLLAALTFSLPLSTALLWHKLRQLPSTTLAHPPRFRLRELTAIGLSMLGLSVAAYFLTVFVDVAIAGNVFGQGTLDFDLYSAARRLMFMAFITPQLAGSLVSPAIANAFYRGDSATTLQSLLKRYGWYGAIPSLMIAVALLMLPGLLLGSYLGEKFAGAASTTQILAIAPLFAAWSGLGGYALAVTGYQRYCILVNVLAGLFVLIAGFPAAHYAQAHGLAWVCVAGFVFKHAAEWFLARRLLGVWANVV